MGSRLGPGDDPGATEVGKSLADTAARHRCQDEFAFASEGYMRGNLDLTLKTP